MSYIHRGQALFTVTDKFSLLTTQEGNLAHLGFLNLHSTTLNIVIFYIYVLIIIIVICLLCSIICCCICKRNLLIVTQGVEMFCLFNALTFKDIFCSQLIYLLCREPICFTVSGGTSSINHS